MKKTVNHVTYNTDTAELIETRRNEEKRYTETLYKTKKGEYFLVGSGYGPYKHTAHPSGEGHGRPHTWSIDQPGQKLLPLTDAEAAEWLEPLRK